MTEEFRIDLIYPNPWQPRLTEDQDHIANLAVSIADDGLMQVPTARSIEGDRVQLAFGHSRLEAYRLLARLQSDQISGRKIDAEQDSPIARAAATAARSLELGTTYELMPLHITEIDDESMYRFAVSENVQRRDLSPIETARAMQRYKVEFGKKSAEIGALFGVNEATVRGTLRLLDLPDALQTKLASGEMSISDARKVLSVKHLLSDAEVANLVSDRFTNGRSIAEALQANIDAGGLKLITMWSRWSSGQPCGGDTLWPLTWTYKTPPYRMPSEKEFEKLWPGEKEIRGRSVGSLARDLANSITTIAPHLSKTWAQLYAENKPDIHPVIDLLKQMAEPPACTACTYYLKNDGNHLCGLKACWDNKFSSWVQKEINDLSKKTGIKIYDPQRDGRTVEKLEFYHDRDKTWWEERHPGLRLSVRKSTWKHGYTNSMNVCVLMTGSVAEKIKAAEKAAKEQGGLEDGWKRESRKRDLYMHAVRVWMLEQVCPTFATVVDGKLADVLLDALAERCRWGGDAIKAKPAAQRVVYDVLYQMNEVEGYARNHNYPEPVQYAANHLLGVAKVWSVKLPPDWMEIAARYEPDLSEFPECQAVSAETEGGES